MKQKKILKSKKRIMRRGVTLLCIFVFCSCSSATKYQKYKKGEGYRDSQSNDLYFTEFKANSYTKLKDAETMAQFRAIEVCGDLQSYFLKTDDLSKVKEVTRTSGTYPFYNTSYSPYRRGWALGVGFGTYSSESWQDKKTYPFVKVTYLCGEKFYAPPGEYKMVSAKELSFVYKDLLGAILVAEAGIISPLNKGDIILKLEGVRIESLGEFYYRFQNNHQQKIEILRDGRRMNIRVKANDITQNVVDFNKEVIERMCKIDKKECRRKN